MRAARTGGLLSPRAGTQEALPQRLPICLLLDALYLNSNVLRLLRELRLDCIITFKEGSASDAYRQFDALCALAPQQELIKCTRGVAHRCRRATTRRVGPPLQLKTPPHHPPKPRAATCRPRTIRQSRARRSPDEYPFFRAGETTLMACRCACCEQ